MAAKAETPEEKDTPRVEGWLNVWEVDVSRQTFDHGRVPAPVWEPHFCTLCRHTRGLHHHRSEKAAEEMGRRRELSASLRLDGTKEAFDRKWGYLTLESINENTTGPLSSLDAFKSQTIDTRSIGSASTDSAYEKECAGERRGSMPIVNADRLGGGGDRLGGGDDLLEPPSTPSRITSFFSRKLIKSNLKRTKSVTKLDRRKTGYNDADVGSIRSRMNNLKRSVSLGRLTRKRELTKVASADSLDGGDSLSLQEDEPDRSLVPGRIRASRSHESLLHLSPSSMHAIDLTAPDVEIKPLHSSILGQEHCFQVATSNGSKYYSCRSAHERQKWIQHLRKTVHPNQERTRRTENALKLWILEAKNLTSKKRYFCELCLDKTLYARTSSKTKGDMLFWGEQFDFKNLPNTEIITINIYKEADKKKKKDKNALLGYIHIPVADINQRQFVEKWYTARSPTVGKSGRENRGDMPLVRVKARFQAINILPMDLYQDLVEYVQMDYQMLVEVLEPQISVKAKEELAACLVSVLLKLGRVTDFLSNIVLAEVDRLENDNLTFRGNSIATKAMEAHMKLVGEKFLQDTLGDFIRTVLDSTDDCEVDPSRVANNALHIRNQGNLITYCEMAWFKIINSQKNFPKELREVFSALRIGCEDRKRGDTSSHLISACIFLRFLCPAILSPSLFHLTQEFPQEKSARNLTLVAKTLQSLANFTKLGGKEEYMTFLNEFVERELPAAHNYISSISTTNETDENHDFDGYIDLGKELSMLHSLLVESLDKINETSGMKLGRLKTILDDITAANRNPLSTVRRNPVNSARIYDNLLPRFNMNHDQNANSAQSPTSPTHMIQSIMKDLSHQNANTDRQNELNSPASESHVNNANLVNQPAATSSNHYPSSSYNPATAYTNHNRITPTVRNYQSTDDYVMFTSIDDSPSIQRLSLAQSTPRPDEKEVNRYWSKMVSAADLVNGENKSIDLISFVDDGTNTEDVQNSSAEMDSASQMSTVTSGYQSVGYSQSSSPVDHQDVAESNGDTSFNGYHGNLQYQGAQHPLHHHHNPQQVSNQQPLPPLSFSNPLFGGPGARQQSASLRSLTRDGSERGRLFRSPSGSSVDSEGDAPRQRASSSSSCTAASTSSYTTTVSTAYYSPARRAPNTASQPSLLTTYNSTSCESLAHRPGNQAHTHPSSTAGSRRKPPTPLSGALSRSSPRVNSPALKLAQSNDPHFVSMATCDLSKSAEFSMLAPQGSPSLKRDTAPTPSSNGRACIAMATPPPSPHLMGSPYSSRSGVHTHHTRSPGHSPSVRMGVSSVHHRKKEAGHQDYEQELSVLRQQLAQTQAMLQETQHRLCSEETQRHRMETDYTTRMGSTEDRLNSTRTEKDGQVTCIMKRLHSVEEKRATEQTKLQSMVNQKEQIISVQEAKIQSLDAANNRLLQALSQLKDRCHLPSRNGVAGTPRGQLHSTNPAHMQLSLADDGKLKSSSC